MHEFLFVCDLPYCSDQLPENIGEESRRDNVLGYVAIVGPPPRDVGLAIIVVVGCHLASAGVGFTLPNIFIYSYS